MDAVDSDDADDIDEDVDHDDDADADDDNCIDDGAAAVTTVGFDDDNDSAVLSSLTSTCLTTSSDFRDTCDSVLGVP